MWGKEIYYSTDFTKFLVDVVKTSDAEITYIWECPYQRAQLSPEKWYKDVSDEDKNIRRIKKVIEYTNWNMEIFYPEADNSYRFSRKDRYSLNYI